VSYQIKSRIWIESNDGVFLGEGRIRLLRAIAKEGSLNKAAKSLKMSYKKAWKLIDTINKAAPEPLVLTTSGGNGGGGSQITPYGHKMIVTFEQINQNCWKFLDQQLAKHKL